MPFEILYDGLVRRFSVLLPPDWMTVIEQTSPLMMMVFVGDGPIATTTIGGAQVPGLSAVTGVLRQLRPLAAPTPEDLLAGLTNNPAWSLEYDDIDPRVDGVVWPKYVAIFVEGIDPTDQLSRPLRGFSTALQPHDLGPFEVLYGEPRVGSEVGLLAEITNLIAAQLFETYNLRHLLADRKATEEEVVDKAFLVGFGRAATLALEALNDPVFKGAALVVGGAGASNGGRRISDIDLKFVAPNLDVPVITPAGGDKCILAIAGDFAHLGYASDDAALNIGRAPNAVSIADLVANRVTNTDEFAREEQTVFGSLRRWEVGMNLPGFGGIIVPFGPPVVKAEQGLEGGPVIHVWLDVALGDAWPSLADGTATYEGITEIYRFFDRYGN